MTAPQSATPQIGIANIGSWLLLLAFVVMFGSSIVYRLEHPSRVIQTTPQAQTDHGDTGAPAMGAQGMPGAGSAGPLPQEDAQAMGRMGQGAMAEIGRLMGELQKNPDDVDTLVAIGRSFLAAKSLERASGFAQRALAVAPEDPQVLELGAMVAFAEEDHARAAELFERHIAVAGPGEGVVLYNLGMLYKHYLKDDAKAADAFARAASVATDEELKKRLAAEGAAP